MDYIPTCLLKRKSQANHKERTTLQCKKSGHKKSAAREKRGRSQGKKESLKFLCKSRRRLQNLDNILGGIFQIKFRLKNVDVATISQYLILP